MLDLCIWICLVKWEGYVDYILQDVADDDNDVQYGELRLLDHPGSYRRYWNVKLQHLVFTPTSTRQTQYQDGLLNHLIPIYIAGHSLDNWKVTGGSTPKTITFLVKKIIKLIFISFLGILLLSIHSCILQWMGAGDSVTDKNNLSW